MAGVVLHFFKMDNILLLDKWERRKKNCTDIDMPGQVDLHWCQDLPQMNQGKN